MGLANAHLPRVPPHTALPGSSWEWRGGLGGTSRPPERGSIIKRAQGRAGRFIILSRA
jgi:hypothetical protein